MSAKPTSGPFSRLCSLQREFCSRYIPEPLRPLDSVVLGRSPIGSNLGDFSKVPKATLPDYGTIEEASQQDKSF